MGGEDSSTRSLSFRCARRKPSTLLAGEAEVGVDAVASVHLKLLGAGVIDLRGTLAPNALTPIGVQPCF